MTHQETPQVETWPLIRALGGVGTFCGLLIVLTWQLTLPTITRKKAIYLENAVYRTLPGATKLKTFAAVGEQLVDSEGVAEPDALFYVGYNKNNQLVGIALTAAGQGFQDTLRILYGYDPEKETLIGFGVLESRETPGLGDKIEKDPVFLANFEALDVALAHGAPANPITLVPKGAKENPWEIDAISGATITSRAVVDILAKDTARWLPLLQQNRQLFEEASLD